MLRTVSDKELMKMTKEQLIEIIRVREEIIKRQEYAHNESIRTNYQNDFNCDIIRSLLKSIENLSQSKGGE